MLHDVMVIEGNKRKADKLCGLIIVQFACTYVHH